MNVAVQDLLDWALDLAGGDRDAANRLLSKLDLAPPGEQRVEDYWCSPVNVSTFACTGMAGAHFGFIDTDDEIQPIVLVAPDSGERPCTIVGESLHEFLCLGCQNGFGLMVELPHRPAKIVERLEGPPKAGPLYDERNELLRSLRERFELKPWPSIGQRLFELQQLYLEGLDMPEN